MNSKQPIYPVEPWSVTETAFNMADNYRNETIFSLSNGYIGTRGTFEEGYEFNTDQGLEGNFINGFYESEPIRYGEWNFGFPEHSQTLLNLPNLKTTKVYLDGEWFDMRTGSIEDYRRTLNLREGIVTRSLTWTSPYGKHIRIETTRFVSFVMKNIMVQRIRIIPLDFKGEIGLLSMLDANVENHTRVTNPLIDYGPFGRTLNADKITAINDMLFYAGRTTNSGLKMACGCVHLLTSERTDKCYETEKFRCSVRYTAAGEVTMDKFIAYTSSLDIPDAEFNGYIRWILHEAKQQGFDVLAQKQRDYMTSFWENADVEIDGDDVIQQGIRFNLFHVMQSAGRDGRTGMGAKGLSGEGYEGHYFWDTEIYVLPVLIHTFPNLAKSLLDYRYSTLDAARARARVLGHAQGALYPWRTINGEECSTCVPLGTAQYHINADVAYAFTQYVKITGDTDYLKAKAAEVLCETARVWADVGSFSEARGGKYCICCVTGPDEYSAFVDNNFYTNLMARESLKSAVSALKWLEENDLNAFDALRRKINLQLSEPVLWQSIAGNMYLPRDEKKGVYLPDDGFFLRKPWDDRQIPPEKRHLLYENYHPLFIWRQRMAKQADTILAMFLHSGYFDCEEMSRNYDFYQEFTLHHSSLSTCVFGIAASAIGRTDEAYRYFNDSARMDMDDHHNNVYAGIHAANMAGTWQAIVFGFAGLRINSDPKSPLADGLELSPKLPGRWNGYRFRIFFKGMPLEVSVQKSGCSVRLLDGESLNVILYGEKRRLEKEEILCANIK
ncbi:MAG: beta-phosphoglucomutase [Treponema sp.]|jgi:alpha,alpha-trehalose phosphorylase|nr:beta-phosphoglucomutase [Treponema sp.]